jgi:hypothetical protein
MTPQDHNASVQVRGRMRQPPRCRVKGAAVFPPVRSLRGFAIAFGAP